jgi:four helix bundle protein
MTRLWGHEKLVVYQKGLRFVGLRGDLLSRLTRRVAACDHLERGSESVLVNIAHASNTWSPNERIVYLGHANGSALECAACLDVMVAKAMLGSEQIQAGKSLLSEIVSILITMRKTTAGRVREEEGRYRTEKGHFFDHEDLDVYQAALTLVACLDPVLASFSCSADLCSKLDKSTTSIVLNIAEGNGRFTGADKSKFYQTAHKATIHSSALLDLAGSSGMNEAEHIAESRTVLRRLAAMLKELSKAVSHS